MGIVSILQFLTERDVFQQKLYPNWLSEARSEGIICAYVLLKRLQAATASSYNGWVLLHGISPVLETESIDISLTDLEREIGTGTFT